jgi:hypothetical protein
MGKPRPTTPKRLEDVKITPVSWRMFEQAVDRALRPAHPPPAKKAGNREPAKRRVAKRGPVS